MANKKQEKQEQKELKEKEAIENVRTYFALSQLLFGMGDKSPYEINELKPDSQFYEHAKELASELEINWDEMTHEESNRIMLSLLDDYFNQINVDDCYNYTLLIKAEKKGGK